MYNDPVLQRCDGERPFCTQCVIGNRTEDCEYTDVQGRTRTQLLEETVALLQARIQELESPNVASQSIYLHDPYAETRNRGTEQTTSVADTEESNSSMTEWWEFDEPPADMARTL